jgi:hypothetical protein
MQLNKFRIAKPICQRAALLPQQTASISHTRHERKQAVEGQEYDMGTPFPCLTKTLSDCKSVDHSMTIKNYAFYSSNLFKYKFKEKFQYPVQNAKE